MLYYSNPALSSPTRDTLLKGGYKDKEEDMISIPSVQLSMWQVKVHVCFYCTCSEQLPCGVVWTLTASWLCTMAANAGASENRIVTNKTQRAGFGPILDSYVKLMGQWTTTQSFVVCANWSCHVHITLRPLCPPSDTWQGPVYHAEVPIFRRTTRPSISHWSAHLQTHDKVQYIALKCPSSNTWQGPDSGNVEKTVYQF